MCCKYKAMNILCSDSLVMHLLNSSKRHLTSFVSPTFLVLQATPLAEREGSGHTATTKLSPRNTIIK